MLGFKQKPQSVLQPRFHLFRFPKRCAWEVVILDINWLHVAFKFCAFAYISFMAWITWQVLPIRGHWTTDVHSDRLSLNHQKVTNYFHSFNGFSTCEIHAADLYDAGRDEHNHHFHNSFCPNRKVLLEAMSNGGRIGFDAPYITKGCQYRWYSITEICMILERFDSLVFVGDYSLQSIYNGLNILLRQDLAGGALQTWTMDTATKADCKCENQFIKSSCTKHFVTASDQVNKGLGHDNRIHDSNYVCDRTQHAFIDIDGSKPNQATADKFNRMFPRVAKSQYKPIPVIYSVSPMTASHKDTSVSMLEFIHTADHSGRKTPMLWVGPTAAGHVEIKGRKSNQEIWDFDNVVAKTARENDIEVLKMWNMTIQANSWDGIRFGSRVALVQAMMVINWLSRLESS